MAFKPRCNLCGGYHWPDRPHNINWTYGSLARSFLRRERTFVQIINMDALYPWALSVPEMRDLIVFCAAASYQSGGWWMNGYGTV